MVRAKKRPPGERVIFQGLSLGGLGRKRTALTETRARRMTNLAR